MALPFHTVELLRQGYVYDPLLLAWVPGQQAILNAGTVVISGSVTVGSSALPTGASTEAKQDTGNTSLASIDGKLASPLPVIGPGRAITPVSGSVSGVGNNTLLTPAAGKKLRVHYLAYNNSGGAVEAAFRFGAAGALFLRNNLLVAGSVVAKDYGDLRYVEGAIDEPLLLNLSGAVATIWNANYVEI